MLKSIGLMIGAFIFTSMVEMYCRESSDFVVKLLCAITAILTLVCMFRIFILPIEM